VKGITPVIAIILLLMITIALIGFAFVWFTSISATLTNQTSQQLTEQQRKMMTAAKIDNMLVDQPAGSNILYIRNTGTVKLLKSETKVYVNDSIEIDCPSSDIDPGDVDACTPTTGDQNAILGGCGTIKITTIGTGDVKSCP